MGQWADNPHEMQKAHDRWGWLGVVAFIFAQPWPYIVVFIIYALVTR